MGSDLVSIEQGVSTGAVYGNQGNDSVGECGAGNATKPRLYGGSGNDSVDLNAQAVTSVYFAGGLDADTLKVGALSSSTVYGDSSGSTLGGADSISANGVASGSYIYGNVGNDRVSLAAGLVAGSVYGGSGADSLWVAAGASTSALIDGGVGNDFLSVAGLSGTSSLLGAVGDDTLMVAWLHNTVVRRCW